LMTQASRRWLMQERSQSCCPARSKPYERRSCRRSMLCAPKTCRPHLPRSATPALRR
jgi:hypothetical protein